ncbi:MAG: FAD-dependent oxidoreductase, partial [Planctomycetes bacterium]|nr:FAD-dependent oxidoreductase [Planctomycetota bacterium]
MSPSRKTQVVVIGAGISGLATAYRLAQAGLDVHVLEKADRVGGVVTTEQKVDEFGHVRLGGVGLTVGEVGALGRGIDEQRDANGKPTGIPQSVGGLAGVNADAEKLRLEQSVRQGIASRIPGLRLRTIDGAQDGPVLIIRVPRSWAAPHMVTYKNWSRFYTRTSAGKHQLDVGEIRAAVLLSETIAD